MYEPKSEPLISYRRFIKRVLIHATISVGVIGYEYFEQLQWRDAFLNSAMLLGGMEPVNPPLSDNGKIFAGVYALYAGLVFILVAGLTLSPVAHRILHKFHWGQGK